MLAILYAERKKVQAFDDSACKYLEDIIFSENGVRYSRAYELLSSLSSNHAEVLDEDEYEDYFDADDGDDEDDEKEDEEEDDYDSDE